MASVPDTLLEPSGPGSGSRPIDVLKIDRSFVSHIADDHDASIIGDSIVRLGRALKLTVVADGIETEDQLRALQRMSCTQGQGYHFARPQNAAHTTELLTSCADGSLGTMRRASTASVV
jgi:EAL domain-containing protein (putative c-di-GMP-specific phosphodiesterase class I)